VPAIFLSVIVLGFCSWEGGFIGIQEPHLDFQRFQDDLENGEHVLIVDADRDQEVILRKVVSEHPKLKNAGKGSSTPGLLIRARNIFPRSMWRGREYRYQ
jgi:hypothetical protein